MAKVLDLPLVWVVLGQVSPQVGVVWGLSVEQIEPTLLPQSLLVADEAIFLANIENYDQHYPGVKSSNFLESFDLCFLAALPLKTGNGNRFGTLFLADRRVREFSSEHRSMVLEFASLLVEVLELKLVTARSVEVEAALRDSEAEMRALFAALKDVILVLNSEGRYLKIAPTNPRLLHISEDEKLGKTLHEIFPQQQADMFLSLVRYTLASQQTVSAEYSLSIEGEEVWFSTNITPLSEDTVVWVARDVTEQQQAEEALQQSVAQIRLIMDSVPARIAYVDREQHYRFVNHQYEEWFQIPAEEIVGKHMRELLGEPIYQGCLPAIETVLSGQQVIYEDNMISIKGKEHYFQVTFTPHFREQEVLGFYVLVQDITEIKFAEAVLRSNEERFRALIQDLQVGILVQGADAEILLCNRAAIDLLGVTEEQLLGRTSFDPTWNVIHEDGSVFPGATHPVPQAIATGKSVKNVIMGVYRPSMGDRVWLLVNAEPRLTAEGRVAQVICSFSDITAYKQSQAELSALFAALDDVILVVDAGGRYLKIAPTDPNLLYKPAPDLIGKRAHEVFPPALADYFVGQVRLALESKQRIQTEYSLQIGDREVWFSASISPLSDSTAIWVARDITQQKQAEVVLRQSNEELEAKVQERTAELERVRAQEQELAELKARFITTASHEFRTPLTVILTSAELLKREDIQWTDEKRMKYLQRIQDAIRSLTLIMNDIFTISKVEAGKLGFMPTPLNLESFCQDLLDDLQFQVARQYQLKLNYDRTLTHICLDETLLWQILTNLLSNAIKYSPQGSRIDLDIHQQDSAVVFTIRDQGIGIPEQDMPYLFESFHRGSNVGTISGTGLGLTIVRRCVELHGGSITVESAVGAGTTFTVIIPINQEVGQA
ncbi:hypothetical protein BST81_18335 [Leptolyngbya sp. 'hensonii']|nr:hypothetical protein BST81_18335 [Leptolyngbya sp. 'hensonii']